MSESAAQTSFERELINRSMQADDDGYNPFASYVNRSMETDDLDALFAPKLEHIPPLRKFHELEPSPLLCDAAVGTDFDLRKMSFLRPVIINSTPAPHKWSPRSAACA